MSESFQLPGLGPPKRRRSWTLAVELALCVGVLALAACTPPRTPDGRPNAPLMTALEAQGAGGLCLYKRETGLDCGGCGLTRAFVQLAHGELEPALRLNPLAPIAFGYLLVHIAGLLAVFAGRSLELGIPNRWRWRGYGLVFVALNLLWLHRFIDGWAWHA